MQVLYQVSFRVNLWELRNIFWPFALHMSQENTMDLVFKCKKSVQDITVDDEI